MSLRSDLGAARRLLRNAFRSRANRREAATRAPELFRRPAPGSLRVAVYFADNRTNLYQVRQWYAPLRELASTHPVVVISRSPGAAVTIAEESGLPTQYLRSVLELEEFLDEQQLRIVLYVNQNARNFQMFRYSRMWHVFINHGESDKMYMTTNQFKAYDYALVAGQAARDRLSRKLWSYDVDRRTIEIGRPQADHFAGALPYPADDRVVVLYAPTWEGDRAAALYGSVASHGVALTEAVLASPSHRLIYRPHPRSGVVDPAFGDANRRIIDAIAAANRADAGAHHVYDDGPEMGWQLAAADVAITDISAMVYDRLATGKPIIVTRPVEPEAEVDEDGFLGSAQWLEAGDASHVLGAVDRALRDPDAQASVTRWARHHFGDTSPGAATARFHAAIDRLSAEWEAEAELHAHEAEDRDPAPLIDDDSEE